MKGKAMANEGVYEKIFDDMIFDDMRACMSKDSEDNLEKIKEFIKDDHPRFIYPHGNRLEIQFCGWAIVLMKDGTWFWYDTSGG